MIAKYKQIKKQSWQTIFLSVLLGSLVLSIVSLLVVSNLRISKKRTLLDSQIDKLKAEISAAEEKKQQLEAQLNQSSREDYLEKEARETFNLKKPGEEVVTILPQEEKPQQEEEEIKQWLAPLETLLKRIF